MVDIYTSLHKLIMKLNDQYLEISFWVAGSNGLMLATHTERKEAPNYCL